MAIQLTTEQETWLQAVVKSGGYSSVEDALNAALRVVETATHPAFDGSAEEFDALIAEGSSSGELGEEEFWATLNQETDAILAVHKQRNP